MRTLTAAIALTLLLACATTAEAPTRSLRWVLVVNQTLDPLAIRGGGGRTGRVMPGRSECVEVRRSGNIRLLADAVAGPTRASPELDGLERGWRWTVRMSDPVDLALALVPFAPCGP